MLLSKWAVYDSKKLRFIKEQEASGLLSSLRMTTPLIQIPLVYFISRNKRMPEIHLRQPGFTYSDYGLFTKNKERIQTF